jgi:hypothetical protein
MRTENTCTSPFDHVKEIGVDKLKFCIRSAQCDRLLSDLLQERFETLRAKATTHKFSSKGKAFRRRLGVRVGEGLVVIECEPNKPLYPWALTAEFNPNVYLRQGARAIVRLASFFRFLLGQEASRLLPNAVVTMLHVNADFDVNPLEGTLVVAKGKRGGAKVMYDFDGHGTLGSLYVGVLGSDRRLCIYDKATEVLHRECEKYANRILMALASDKWDIQVSKLREKFSGPDRWRLEVRCEPKDAIPVSRITDFASCFDGIRFLHLPTDTPPFNTSLGRLFVASARSDGINVALKTLDDNERRRFNRGIDRLQDLEWFDTEILRDAIADTIAKLSPLFAPPRRRLKVRSADMPSAGSQPPHSPQPTQQGAPFANPNRPKL